MSPKWIIYLLICFIHTEIIFSREKCQRRLSIPPTGTLIVSIFRDDNSNDIFDNNEIFLSGITISVNNISIISNNQGMAIFENLNVGMYNIDIDESCGFTTSTNPSTVIILPNQIVNEEKAYVPTGHIIVALPGTSLIEYDVLGNIIRDFNGQGDAIDVEPVTNIVYTGTFNTDTLYQYNMVESVFVNDNLLDSVNDIKWGPDGNLYAIRYNNGAIVKITPTGVITVSIFASFSQPVQLAFSNDGTKLFVADRTSNLKIFEFPSLTEMSPISVIGKFLQGVAIDPNNSDFVYVLDAAGGTLEQINLITSTVTNLLPTGTFSNPWKLVISNDGTFLISEFSGNIKKYDGTSVTDFLSGLTGVPSIWVDF